MLQQFRLVAFVLQPFVRTVPDAIAVTLHFAAAVARAAARAVPLVLGALRFRTQKRNVRQRTIPAIFALKENGFADMFQQAHRPGALFRIGRILTKPRAQFRQRTVRAEHQVVGPFRQVIDGAGVF